MSELMYYDKISDDLKQYVVKPESDEHLQARKYRLQILSQMEHSHGIAWSAMLLSDNKPFVQVENMGTGGCNYYSIINDEIFDIFAEDAYTAYGNSGESKDSLCQYIDILTEEGILC